MGKLSETPIIETMKMGVTLSLPRFHIGTINLILVWYIVKNERKT